MQGQNVTGWLKHSQELQASWKDKPVMNYSPVTGHSCWPDTARNSRAGPALQREGGLGLVPLDWQQGCQPPTCRVVAGCLKWCNSTRPKPGIWRQKALLLQAVKISTTLDSIQTTQNPHYSWECYAGLRFQHSVTEIAVSEHHNIPEEHIFSCTPGELS